MSGENEQRAPVFNPLIEHAIELSAQWHDQTYRKGRWRDPAFDLPTEEILQVPVFAHVTAVAMIVQKAGWDDVTVAAAFLHDVIEDGNRYGDEFRYDELATIMGLEVADLVQEVSEPKADSAGESQGWHVRKEAYIESISNGSDRAIAISLADKLHNLWSINETLLSGINVFRASRRHRGLGAGPDEQMWFYRAVLQQSESRGDERYVGLREQLSAEIARFRKTIASNGFDTPPR